MICCITTFICLCCKYVWLWLHNSQCIVLKFLMDGPPHISYQPASMTLTICALITKSRSRERVGLLLNAYKMLPPPTLLTFNTTTNISYWIYEITSTCNRSFMKYGQSFSMTLYFWSLEVKNTMYNVYSFMLWT